MEVMELPWRSSLYEVTGSVIKSKRLRSLTYLNLPLAPAEAVALLDIA